MQESVLFKEAEEIIQVCKHFKEHIQWGKSSWINDSEAIKLVISQIEVLESTKELVKNEKIVEGFILLRTIFENFFIVSLILNGTKYKRKYVVERNLNETPEQAHRKLENQLREKIKKGRNNIVTFYPLRKYKNIEIVYTGFYSEDQERLIPSYYFFFKQYDPVRHRIDKIKSISSKDIFSEHKIKWQKSHQYLYNYYLSPQQLIEFAVLNDIINEEQKVRFQVHYNFLSGFSHLTNTGYDLIHNYPQNRNLHYLKEISLLYVIMLSSYYITLLLKYFKRVGLPIKNHVQLKEKINQINKLFYYFWFIYNESSTYDEYMYMTQKTFHKRKGKELDDKIPYYKNPFERLKNQHRSTWELSTGLHYNPPWEQHTNHFYY